MISTRRPPTEDGARAAGLAPPRLLEGEVTRSEDAAPDVGLLAFRSPELARDYRPGRFLQLKTGDASTLLRRPFSLSRVVGDDVILLYRIVGSGTEWMRARRPGDRLDLMGPLGTAFDLRPLAARTLLVGGGLGIAPLLGLSEALRREGATGPIEALFGVRSAGDVFGPALTEGVEGLEWRLATDDGTEGFRGHAVQLLEARLDELAADGLSGDDLAIYAAGPEPMLESAAKLCLARGLDLQVSMEAHMACGVGACRACGIVPWADESRIHGRVCKEGPVFDARDIRWEAFE